MAHLKISGTLVCYGTAVENHRVKRHSHMSFLPLTTTILATVDLVKIYFFGSNVKLVVKRDILLGQNSIYWGEFYHYEGVMRTRRR